MNLKISEETNQHLAHSISITLLLNKKKMACYLLSLCSIVLSDLSQ